MEEEIKMKMKNASLVREDKSKGRDTAVDKLLASILTI